MRNFKIRWSWGWPVKHSSVRHPNPEQDVRSAPSRSRPNGLDPQIANFFRRSRALHVHRPCRHRAGSMSSVATAESQRVVSYLFLDPFQLDEYPLFILELFNVMQHTPFQFDDDTGRSAHPLLNREYFHHPWRLVQRAAFQWRVLRCRLERRARGFFGLPRAADVDTAAAASRHPDSWSRRPTVQLRSVRCAVLE